MNTLRYQEKTHGKVRAGRRAVSLHLGSVHVRAGEGSQRRVALSKGITQDNVEKSRNRQRPVGLRRKGDQREKGGVKKKTQLRRLPAGSGQDG